MEQKKETQKKLKRQTRQNKNGTRNVAYAESEFLGKW